MPRVSVWLVRSSLLYLTLGVTLGAGFLVQKAGWWVMGGAWLVSVHREILLVGWLVQLAMGVGFWILPPVRDRAIRQRPAWTVAALLNAGLLLFVLGSLPAVGGGGLASQLLARVLEALAVLGFGVPLMTRAFR